MEKQHTIRPATPSSSRAKFLDSLHRSHARGYAQRGGDSGQNRDHRLNDELPSVLFHKH